MAEIQGKYNIKAVSKLIGVQPGTLRAWERRYQIISPKRNEAGYRLYTEDHVKMLKWLVNKVNQGISISQAIKLLDEFELNNDDYFEERSDLNRLEIISDQLLQTLTHFNERNAREILHHAYSLYSLDQVLVDVLGRGLLNVRSQCENNILLSEQEQFASTFIRSQISAALYTLPVNSIFPKVISVCGPEEIDESELLSFTLFLKRSGYDVVYVGSSIPTDNISIILEKTCPSFVFLSCTLQKNVSQTLKLAQNLNEKYRDLSVGIRGQAVEYLLQEKNEHRHLILGKTKYEWQNWLQLYQKQL
ncbi:MerR family transcriptional regulator [Bacillus solimangrovi]|uniref:MerR family transcriptional regulator n=1 Tax=Bacillus solimangrovi TaxID=1305675 RepID=A0A1E5LHD2_9BACI|nr:MerR family transcriptional regulator [Bacillus solimangrovi]OEH93485.1 MerR family transcriptional regulator [Bacillus solimangrovi]